MSVTNGWWRKSNCGFDPFCHRGQSGASGPDRAALRQKNRRKQSQPGSRPGTPPCISIRPHSDLFPPQPAATSTPRGHKEARDYSPARKMSRSQSPPPPQSKSPVATKLFNEEKENKDAFRNQLLQVDHHFIHHRACRYTAVISRCSLPAVCLASLAHPRQRC